MCVSVCVYSRMCAAMLRNARVVAAQHRTSLYMTTLHISRVSLFAFYGHENYVLRPHACSLASTAVLVSAYFVCALTVFCVGKGDAVELFFLLWLENDNRRQTEIYTHFSAFHLPVRRLSRLFIDMAIFVQTNSAVIHLNYTTLMR